MIQRPEINEFATMMEFQLRKKDHLHPNGWDNDTVKTLHDRLDMKLGQLAAVLNSEYSNETAEIAADAANYLMMIVDKKVKEKANVYVI